MNMYLLLLTVFTLLRDWNRPISEALTYTALLREYQHPPLPLQGLYMMQRLPNVSCVFLLFE